MTKKKLGSNKVREGKSSIPLKVKDKLELGQYPLNIEYEENRTYAESNAYGTLFYGWKSFVHCPNIYVVEGEDMYTTLRANIFSNEDIVYAGEGSFSIKEKTQEKVPVEDGCATHHLSDIQSWKNKNPYFSFLYDVHLPLNYCSARSNTAEIIYLPHTKRYAVVVKIITDPVIGYTGDTVRVIARIYKAQYGSLIDHKDVPDNGYARLLIDGAVAGTTSITDTGYVSFDYTVPEMGCGVYSVVVEYVSQDEYYDDSACEGTLFVPSHDVTLPTATCTQIWHTLGGTASIPVTFSDISLFDKVQVYIDSQLVPVEGSDENGYLIVQGTEVTLTFNIPKGYSSKCVWAYSGEHLMYLEYTDNVHHVTRKLFLPFLLIQYPTAIQLKSYGLDDTSTMIVGNNIEGTVINTFEPKRFVNHGLITIDIEGLEVLLSVTRDVDCSMGVQHPQGILFVNETCTFRITAQSNTTVPIPNRTVTLVTGNQNYTSTTDEDGVATFSKKYTQSGTDTVYALFPGTETEAETQTTPVTLEILDLIKSELSHEISSDNLITSITPIRESFPHGGTISVTFKPVPLFTVIPPLQDNFKVGESIVIKANVSLEYKPAVDIPVILRVSITKEDGTVQDYESLQTMKTDSVGDITCTTAQDVSGECRYTLFIEGTDDYEQCVSDEIILDVTRIQTTISSTVTNNQAGSSSIDVTLIDEDNKGVVDVNIIVTLTDGSTMSGTTDSSGNVNIPLTSLQVGSHTLTVSFPGNNKYEPASTTCTIDIAPNIDFYNSANWGGNPVIDVTNQKITMTGANITYYEGASVKDLLSDTAISLTYFHNGRDGRKALGVYNPELSSWIGYCTPSPNGSEGHGVNEEKGYTHNISTDVTNAASWMRDGQESPLVIGYNEVEDNISLQYTSQDGTENVTVTIPLEGVDLSKYYLAFYDYHGLGMYVKNITLMEDM